MTMPDKIATPYPPHPDTSHLITEDDRPVDNRFSERQQRMLPHILHTSWHEAKPFEALSNVGLFSSLQNEDVVVPDFLLSLGITPRPVTGSAEDRSYLMWVYGKAPDLVIEIVSNTVGGELTTRFEKYARIRVTYYAVYDPFRCIGKPELRLYHLVDGRYVDMTPSSFMTEVGLGLIVWEGSFEGVASRWLRFLDREGKMLPTADEATQNASLEIARRFIPEGVDPALILKVTGIDLSFPE
jgi:Uma2 family endonuclease